jgi:hypothetical protein
VDADSSNIASGSEATFTATSSNVAAGDLVVVVPPTDTAATNVVWSAYTSASTVHITLSNLHATDPYTQNSAWAFMVIKVGAAGTC